MSMHVLKSNLDRGAYHDAEKAQQARLGALAEFRKAALSPHAVTERAAGGLYKAAAGERGPDDEPVDTLDWMRAQAEAAGVGPTDAELKNYEEYYLAEFHVRPGDNQRARKVKRYARNRWAIDTLFEDEGIILPGPKALESPVASMPTVERAYKGAGQKSFVTSTTQVIFPFYYAAAIQKGILAMPITERLIMEDIPVNSHTVDHAMMTDITGDRITTLSGEGVTGNEIIIRATNHPINLIKFKSKALATYEAIRLQRIPLFEAGLMRVGQQFALQISHRAVDVAVNGDGTTVAPGGGAAPTYAAGVSGAPTYKDIVSLDTTFPMGYETLDGVWVMDINPLNRVLNMAEFKDPLAGWHYQNDGAYPSPIGKGIYRWDATAGVSGIIGGITGWGTGSVMQVKSGSAMVKYTEGGLLIETDRLIDGQWDMVVSSTWTDFAIWDRRAVVVGINF